MENLEILYHFRKSVNTSKLGNPVNCHLQVDVCCFVTDRQFLVVINLNHDNVIAVKLPVEAEYSKYARYIRLHEAFCLGNHNNLVVFHPTAKEFDTVFKSPQVEFTAFSFNPEENFLVVANAKDELLGFSYEGHLRVFNCVHKTTLNAKVPNSVYVGWGSPTAQFKGARCLKAENTEDFYMPYDHPEISWRGNGEQFVINYWQDGRRLLKVFDSALNPLYKSEGYSKLLKLVSFKGQGNCVACTAIHNLQNKIVIFEKNCLIKSEFLIFENKGQLKNILFHPNENFFAVHYKVEQSFDYINVYVLSSAKWYLKQQLRFTNDRSVIGFSWVDTDDIQSTTSKLNVATLSGFEIFIFRSVINRSPTCAVVANIEGKNAKFIFFENEITPPPYNTETFACDNPINRIFFHPVGALCLILDASFAIKIIEFDEKAMCLKERMSIDLSITYIPEKNVLSFIDNCFTSREIDFNFEAEFVTNRKEGNILPFNDTYENVVSLDLESNENKNIVFCTGKTLNGIFYEFSLTASQKLLVNKMEVASNISSLLIYKKYLLLTQSSKLFTIFLEEALLRNSCWDLNQFYYQEVEQGIKLVTVIRKNSVVLVLVPRGNLECVTSRIITVNIVEEILEDFKWRDAAILIRKEKLNWNLLIDLNPIRFENNIGEFIQAVEPLGILETLMADINTDNCLYSVYRQCVFHKKHEAYDKSRVLTIILDYLNTEDTIKYIITIVTILSRHFSLKAAIKMIYTVFNQGQQFWGLCENAVCHLLIYCNKKDIIENSYAVFDTYFLRLVNLWCAEDPSVFEPEIKRLQNLPTPKAYFEMSLAAREFGTAIKHLLEVDDAEPSFITNFIMKHEIYNVSYTSVSIESKYFKLISKMYGEHLSSLQKYDEAAFVFLRADMIHEALLEYKNALNWNQVLTLIGTIDNITFREEFLRNFAKDLMEAKKIDAAVLIYLTQLNEFSSAAVAYLDNKQFQNALALASRYKLNGLIEHSIKPTLLKYRIVLIDKINQLEVQFQKYMNRLLVVRSEKVKRNMSEAYSSTTYTSEVGDLISEYGSTNVSRQSTVLTWETRTSTVTAKNRRKEARKKIDLREGGYYEDIALIRQLYILIVETFSIGKDVRELSLILLDNEHMKMCKLIQTNLVLLGKTMKAAIPEIWSQEFLSDATTENFAVTHNKEHLEAKYKVPPSHKDMDETWSCDIF